MRTLAHWPLQSGYFVSSSAQASATASNNATVIAAAATGARYGMAPSVERPPAGRRRGGELRPSARGHIQVILLPNVDITFEHALSSRRTRDAALQVARVAHFVGGGAGGQHGKGRRDARALTAGGVQGDCRDGAHARRIALRSYAAGRRTDALRRTIDRKST